MIRTGQGVGRHLAKPPHWARQSLLSSLLFPTVHQSFPRVTAQETGSNLSPQELLSPNDSGSAAQGSDSHKACLPSDSPRSG